MNPFIIPTKFRAVDEMTGNVRGMAMNVKDAFGVMSASVERQDRMFRKLTPHLGKAAKTLLNYATAGTLLTGLGWSGKSIMDYETSVQSLSAVTGVAGQDLVHFKSEIQDVATQTKKSATDVAGSFEVVGSMMSQYLKDPKALRQITEAGITLSKASRQELVPTLENLTSIMNQFDLKANKALYTVNKLTAGEIVGSLRTAQVAESMQEFGAGAYAANIHLDESVALVEALAKQLKTDKIGVGARNILTVLDSATGLARRARKELKHAGVDMHFLMDKTKSLSERLHELAKVQHDQKAITRIFGRENKTAAQVIFNQLGVYDQCLEQIRKTNAAETQAATNSATLATSVDQLKNTWLNYISTGDAATDGLNKAKDAVHFLTDNMDRIVTIGLDAIKVWALWKGAILAQQGILIGYNTTLLITRGISQAYFLRDMVKYVAVTQGMTTATAAWKITQESLNVAIAANPIGALLTVVAAVGGAYWYATKRAEELNEAYRQKAHLEVGQEMDKETAAVKKLVAQYWDMGKSINEATLAAIRLRVSTIQIRSHDINRRVGQAKSDVEQDKQKHWLRNAVAFKLTNGAYNPSSNSEAAERLEMLERQAKLKSADLDAERKFMESQISQGIIKRGDVSGMFESTAQARTSGSSFWADQFAGKQASGNVRIDQDKARTADEKKLDFDYDKLKMAFSAALKDQKQPVLAMEGIRVGGNSSGLTQPGSY